MIYIRALIGQSYHYLGTDAANEPFLFPIKELGHPLPTRMAAEILLGIVSALPAFNQYPLDIYAEPEPVSCSG